MSWWRWDSWGDDSHDCWSNNNNSWWGGNNSCAVGETRVLPVALVAEEIINLDDLHPIRFLGRCKVAMFECAFRPLAREPKHVLCQRDTWTWA